MGTKGAVEKLPQFAYEDVESRHRAETPTYSSSTPQVVADRLRLFLLEDAEVARQFKEMRESLKLPVFKDDFYGAAGIRDPADISEGPRLRVIEAPFDYDGVWQESTGRPSADAKKGYLSLGAKVGAVEQSKGLRREEGFGWIGVALTSSKTVSVRVSAFITWRSMWTLATGGWAIFADPPWVDWKGGARAQAFDENGAISPLLEERLVHRRLRETRELGIVEDNLHDTGVVPAMHTFLTIPAGATRWFNLLVWGVLECDYGWQSLAAGQCGVELWPKGIVVERL